MKCIEPLGLESGDIPDEALAQSTDASIYTSRPEDIRLNKKVTEYPNGWQAALGVLDYLQIDFGSLRKVTRIASQGGYNVPYYVSGFKLKYSNNSIDWIWYKVDGVEEVKNIEFIFIFSDKSDSGKTVVFHELSAVQFLRAPHACE